MSALTIRSLRETGPVAIAPDLYIYTTPSLQELVHDRVISSLLSEGTLNVPCIPHTGIGYTILGDGFIEQAIQAYVLHRLAHIPQLASLEDPDTTPSGRALATRFSHTRFVHSLDVMTLACVIAYNNQKWFSDHPGWYQVLMLAALTHDVLTPAGGDTIKAIDFAALDEDTWYAEVLEQEAVRNFCTQHNVDTDLLIATVNGKGVLGSILDLADKLAYTARDLFNFLGSGIGDSIPAWKDTAPRRYEIAITTSKLELVCAIWENVAITDGGAVVLSSAKLFEFLKVRALMFRNLYTHPDARHNEVLILYTLLSFLYQRGLVTRQQLLENTNSFLEELLRQHFGIYQHLLYRSYETTYRSFETLEAARAFEQQLVKDRMFFVRVEDAHGFFKPGTHIKTTRNGMIGSFAELWPRAATVIQNYGQLVEPIRVYFLQGDQPRFDELQPAFVAWRMQQLYENT